MRSGYLALMQGRTWTTLASGTVGIALALAVVAPLALPATAYCQAKKPAAAAPPSKTDTLEILGIVSDDVEEQADALSEALRYQARQLPGVTVGKAVQTLDVMTTANKCPQSPDPTCQQEIAKQLKTTQYIWGILKKIPGEKVEVELHHYVKDKAERVHHGTYSVNLRDQNDEALRRTARLLLVELLQLKTGFVHVTGTGPMATCAVRLDGKDVGILRDGTLLAETTPGEHTITTDGCPAFTGTAQVTASHEAIVTLTEPGTKPIGVAPPREESKPYFTGRKIVAASMVGAGLASGIVSVVFLTQYLGNRSAPSDNDTWKISPEGQAAYGTSASKVCESDASRASAARFFSTGGTVSEICGELDAAKRNSTISIITAAVGGALVVGGAVLWATDSKHEGSKTAQHKPKLRLEPSVGSTSGLWLSGTF